MKRKVATLDVYIDPESTDSSVTSGSYGPGNYSITINKGEEPHAVTNMGKFQSTLAHELGHFVGLLTMDASHDVRLAREMRDNGTQGRQILSLPAERKAWEFANIINPYINPEDIKNSLATYERHFWRKCNKWHNVAPVLPEPEPDDFTGRWEDDGGALWQNVVVYHGTTKTAAESIKREGLIPHRETAFNFERTDDDAGSIRNAPYEQIPLVYVTPIKEMAEAFARFRAKYERAKDGAIVQWGGLNEPEKRTANDPRPAQLKKLDSRREVTAEPAIVELTLPENFKHELLPDPNYETLGFVYPGTIPAEYVEDVQVLTWLDYLETRNLAPDLPRYTTPRDIAFYPEDAHSPTVLESHSPTFDKFMQDWAFQNAPVKAEPKPEPIEPMTTGQTIAAVLFLIALFSAASTIVGYALLGAIEVLR